MDAGTTLGLIGAVSGLASFGFTIYAWRVERHDRLAEVAEEREARQSSLAIEQKRLAAELEDRALASKADITATQGGFHGDGVDGRLYMFTLKNMGPAYSKHVSAWLVDDNGAPCSSRTPGYPLEVGDEQEFALHVPRHVWDPPKPVQLLVEWRDTHGQPHQELSNLTVSLS